MSIEFIPEEAELLRTLLEKELADVRVEIHHTDQYDFKQQLKEREKQLQALMEKMRN